MCVSVSKGGEAKYCILQHRTWNKSKNPQLASFDIAWENGGHENELPNIEHQGALLGELGTSHSIFSKASRYRRVHNNTCYACCLPS